MRTLSITGFGEVEATGQHSYSGQPCPREQAKICVSLQETWCSCEKDMLESRYLSSKDLESQVLGDAVNALDRALETVFLLMSNDEVAKVRVFLPAKLVNVSGDVNFTCTAHLMIEENSKVVYELAPAEKLSIGVKYKNIGVALYKEGLLHKQILAFYLFSDAVKWLCMIHTEDAGELVEEIKTIKMQCYNNIALLHLQQGNYNLCVVAATTLLSVEKGNVKALYRRAVANTELQNYELALEDLSAAFPLDPNNKYLKRQWDVVKKKQKSLNDKYASAMKSLFS